MSVTLRQRHNPAQRIDLRGVLPATVNGLPVADIERLPLYAGNRAIPLGELFEVTTTATDPDTLVVVPMDGRIDRIGAGLSTGRVRVQGSAGDLAGAGMSGGTLQIDGDAGNHCGASMRGGQLLVDGGTGDHAGAPLAGERRGQQGGLIRIQGDTGRCAGERQRRGLLLIGGDAGDCLGHRMIAGTIFCAGRAGALAGYGMRRGTLLLTRAARSLPETIVDNGRQSLPFLTLLLRDLDRTLGNNNRLSSGPRSVQRYVGDLACDGRGEILILD